MASRQATYRAREKAKRQELEERFEDARKELQKARVERAKLGKQGAALQARLYSRYDVPWRAAGNLELVHTGPGWDDYHVQVAANMTSQQFWDSYASFAATATSALAAQASDDALAVLTDQRNSFSTRVLQLRFDLIVSLLSMHTRVPRQEVDALARHTAAFFVATITPAQLALMRILYPKISGRLLARHREREAIVASGDLAQLELWTMSNLTELAVISVALRDLPTPRQRAVVAALHRTYYANTLQIFKLSAELLGISAGSAAAG